MKRSKTKQTTKHPSQKRNGLRRKMTKQILRKDKRIHKKRIVTEEGKSLENGRRNEERKRRD